MNERISPFHEIKELSDSLIKANDILRELFGEHDPEINELISKNEIWRRNCLKDFKDKYIKPFLEQINEADKQPN